MPSGSASRSDRSLALANALVSTLALGFIAWVLVGREASAPAGVDLSALPALNAALNALAATLLVAGWWAIRRRRVRLHRRLMIGAFCSSALFLVSYLAYHWMHGDTRYPGHGAARVFYLAVLASHVLLSMTVVPAALAGFALAWQRRFDRHRRLMRVALPIWLYVSVTGVAIFFLLRAAGAPL